MPANLSLQVSLSALQRKLGDLVEIHCFYQKVVNHLQRLYLQEKMSVEVGHEHMGVNGPPIKKKNSEKSNRKIAF